MKLRYSQHFLRSLAATPPEIRRAFEKQAILLAQSLRHPSLRTKKYDPSTDLWQARVTRNWRFYFTIEAEAYYMHEIKPHPK